MTPPFGITEAESGLWIAAITRALWLLDAGENNPNAFNSALASLPTGGVRCEELVEEAVATLRQALNSIAGKGA